MYSLPPTREKPISIDTIRAKIQSVKTVVQANFLALQAHDVAPIRYALHAMESSNGQCVTSLA